MNAIQNTAGYELKNELARLCLPQANRDVNLKFAWANSVCILFLLIGILGARRGVIAIKPAPPIQEIVPVILAPITLPPQETTAQKPADEIKSDAPQIVVAIPQSPNVSFSVPTIGALAVPSNLAVAPPLEPLRTASQIGSLNSTGAGGERPEPPYPKIALESGQQGTVVLTLTGDDSGHVVSVDTKTSSGSPVLDRATVDFIKRHWRLPTDSRTRLFETSITYKLLLN